MFASGSLPVEFADALSCAAVRIQPFGSHVLWFDEVTSTNDVAVRLAEGDAAEGQLVVADSQTAGRGRRGRSWASPPAAGIYATVLLRPGRSAALVTIAAGVALAEGIEAATGLAVRVKWPNDLFVEARGSATKRRKLAGILAEGGTSASGPWVALGFGINVLPAAYPPEVAARATALESELGRPVDRPALLVECLAALSGRYRELTRGGVNAILAAWRRRAAATLGRPVEWDAGERVREGVAVDIDDSGALMVRGETGIERIISGEVRWR